MAVRHVWVAALVLAVAGCGTAPDPPTVAASAPAPSAIPSPAPSASLPLVPPATRTPPARVSASASAPPPAPSPSTRTSTDWEITVYYTAVERFHDGDPAQVTGCPTIECSGGGDDLGSYPSDFVDAVRDEGTGRTVSGRYLNWSYDTGFWLDSAPRTSDGGTLVPFVSAATDPDVLPRGTRFTVAGCGTQEDGSTAPRAVCAALREAAWTITDEFTPGLGGPRHLDAYIGEETGPGFTDSPWYLSLIGARLEIR
ncbi:hypothetical protein [Actinoplanes xinjiangensis]|uniref:Uncharacterized protein n=1 Tax=Actinoplanes xinjiangensis TaxID=512350 RepID=A0A316FHY1_9ACTN|nr:hypothetical protein [Actinoplanes xinjiangensis]PWK48059.1 hypothetical protein BC793_10686 [Actinoplanes xinjiangensis]GIF39190.1 hypothetical protein Axi01nite_35010 [Actinoplanes xinjiangensis]